MFRTLKNNCKKLLFGVIIFLFITFIFSAIPSSASDKKIIYGKQDMSLELVSEIGDMKSNNSELELKLKKKRKLRGAVGAFFKGFFVDEFKKAEISAEMVEGESEESDFFVETFYQED